MAYSNITPPTLPEYDSALYSHYVLEFEYENGSDNWFAVSLRYSSTPFTYDGTAVTNAGEHHLQTYGSGTGEWTYWGTLTEMSIAPGTTSTGGYRRIWTNHNILDGSGKVWLAASTATPAEANLDRLSIMKSKLAGLIMAWCAPVRQFPQREPVAYLYGHVAKEGETPTHTINGVGYVGAVLPDIYKVYTPELQKTHPFVYLKEFVNSKCYGLIICTTNQVYRARKDNPVWGYDLYPTEYPSAWCAAYLYYDDVESGAWQDFSNSGTYESEEDYNSGGGSGLPFWTNFDIRSYYDNSVYMFRTDPIPIYE